MKIINPQTIDDTVYAILSERIDDLREEISLSENGINMLENLRGINQLLNKQIAKCEEIMGRWNGKESGRLEDDAGEYGDILERLESAKEELLEAIKMLNGEY